MPIFHGEASWVGFPDRVSFADPQPVKGTYFLQNDMLAKLLPYLNHGLDDAP
jgi:hypothetical protein